MDPTPRTGTGPSRTGRLPIGSEPLVGLSARRDQPCSFASNFDPPDNASSAERGFYPDRKLSCAGKRRCARPGAPRPLAEPPVRLSSSSDARSSVSPSRRAPLRRLGRLRRAHEARDGLPSGRRPLGAAAADGARGGSTGDRAVVPRDRRCARRRAPARTGTGRPHRRRDPRTARAHREGLPPDRSRPPRGHRRGHGRRSVRIPGLALTGRSSAGHDAWAGGLRGLLPRALRGLGAGHGRPRTRDPPRRAQSIVC